jgi:glutamine---fructose-6-phosphate transaminase (isomerizing)
MEPAVMRDQVRDLPNIARTHAPRWDEAARFVLTPLEHLSLHRVFITGDGDSYNAAMACEMAFENIARIPCEPMSAQRFVDYGAEYLPLPFPNSTLVIGISASGRTQRVVQSLERAKQYGALTLALTGTPDSALAKAADRALIVQAPDMGPSPGIRTYTASLFGLLSMAVRIGELRDRYHQTEANALRQSLSDLASLFEATAIAAEPVARQASAALKDMGAMVFLGSGPSFGTAQFSAAKVIEAAGVFAVGQDLEEWAHVERFAYPDDMPTFVIAPPGRSHARAVELVRSAKALGRRIAVVCRAGDAELAEHAEFVFPVPGDVREEFTPLVYHIAADLFAAQLAEALGRKPFGN